MGRVKRIILRSANGILVAGTVAALIAGGIKAGRQEEEHRRQVYEQVDRFKLCPELYFRRFETCSSNAERQTREMEAEQQIRLADATENASEARNLYKEAGLTFIEINYIDQAREVIRKCNERGFGPEAEELRDIIELRNDALDCYYERSSCVLNDE